MNEGGQFKLYEILLEDLETRFRYRFEIATNRFDAVEKAKLILNQVFDEKDEGQFFIGGYDEIGKSHFEGLVVFEKFG